MTTLDERVDLIRQSLARAADLDARAARGEDVAYSARWAGIHRKLARAAIGDLRLLDLIRR